MKKNRFPQLDLLLPEQRQRALEYIGRAEGQICLPRREKERHCQYMASALALLLKRVVGLEEAVARLGPPGRFYGAEGDFWFPLDNGAKIYPLAMKRGWMATFRISLYMKDPVDPELLQMALNGVIGRFPTFATTLKAGVFWHYLDGSRRRFDVMPENVPPCQPINVSHNGAQSFRVMYFYNRISLECFHVLSDGLGAMAFLQTLAARYVRLKYGVETPPSGMVLDLSEPPKDSELENVFLRGGKAKKAAGFGGRPALQLRGRLAKARPSRVLHFEMEGEALRQKAKAAGTSVTGLMLACIL